MKYFINFQHLPAGKSRPVDHASSSDHEVSAGDIAVVPNVGDLVMINPMGEKGAPRYDGRVVSRLFSYFGADSCSINIVVEDTAEDDDCWAKAIKE